MYVLSLFNCYEMRRQHENDFFFLSYVCEECDELLNWEWIKWIIIEWISKSQTVKVLPTTFLIFCLIKFQVDFHK